MPSAQPTTVVTRQTTSVDAFLPHLRECIAEHGLAQGLEAKALQELFFTQRRRENAGSTLDVGMVRSADGNQLPPQQAKLWSLYERGLRQQFPHLDIALRRILSTREKSPEDTQLLKELSGAFAFVATQDVSQRDTVAALLTRPEGRSFASLCPDRSAREAVETGRRLSALAKSVGISYLDNSPAHNIEGFVGTNDERSLASLARSSPELRIQVLSALETAARELEFSAADIALLKDTFTN
jgi:hypothetical protein